MSTKDNLALMPKEPIQDLNSFAAIIAEMQGKKINVLSPITKVDRLMPMHALALALVPINPSPESGDVWHDPRWKADEHALTHVSLNKLFVAAGGSWLHERCGRVDDRSNPFLVEWTCVGRMKDPTGTIVEAAATKRVDLSQGSPEIKGWDEKRLNEARKFVLELAESKAQNRVIRKLLGVKAKYKEEEIRKPFVVVRSVPLLDMTNPIVAEMATRFALGGTSALYGPSNTKEEVRQVDDTAVREVREIPAHLANDAEDEGPPQSQAPAFTVAEETPTQPLDFDKSDAPTQLRTLAEMMKRKGFPETRLMKPLERFTEKDRADLHKHLQGLKDMDQPAFQL